MVELSRWDGDYMWALKTKMAESARRCFWFMSGRQGALFSVFFMMLAAIVTPVAQPVVAAEIGFIRLGDDYKFRSVPAGKGYRWCERLCKGDDKCKSWTYLRPSRQCRLKSAVAPKYKNDCCVSGEKIGEQNSSTQKLCRQYANKAISDFETNLIENCGFSDRKWSEDFALHFDWCMDATVEDTKDRQRERNQELRQCKRDTKLDNGNVSCRQYAKKALEQHQTNLDHKCGFNNRRRWRNNFNSYLNWCRTNAPQERKKQDKLREEAIARCLKRGGGSFVKRCESYATEALETVNKASQNGCGFRDRGLWKRSFEHHYQFCIRNNDARSRRNGTVQKAKNGRTKALRQCLKDVGRGAGGGYNDDAFIHTGGVEFGYARLGSNYSYKIAPKGSDYLWCEDSCRSDPRCKAWTFVKKIRQCRLKFDLGTKLKNDCCVSGGKSSKKAQSGKSRRCSTYATKVVELFNSSLRDRCHFEDKAWTNKFKDHYRFCMRKPADMVDDDLERKQKLLRQCAKGQWQLDKSCAGYARQAVAQNEMNLQKKCGFTRRTRWFSDFTRHYDWCQNHSRYDRKDANFKRERFLAACVNRGGGRYDKACDLFSQDALKDVTKASKLSCGFTGKDWSVKFGDHYQWCLNSDEWQRRSELQTRQRSLKRCEASGGGKSQARSRCNHYARISGEQLRSNNDNRCGLKYDHWEAGNLTEKWCLRASDRQRDSVFEAREADLKTCFARFVSGEGAGRRDNKACNEYARTALEQFRKGRARKCSLRGAEWSDEFDDHYNWCLKASVRQRKRLIFSRKTVLRTCQLGSFFNFGR